MKTFKKFIFEAYFLLEKRGGNPKYSDEHANINLYNYLVSFPEVRELIKKKDYESIDKTIAQELENAKTDPKHPLNFNNVPDEGFSGKKKTSGHEDVYYSELERAVPGFSSLIQSKKGASIASKGWVGRVSGGEHEASKPSWKGNVKGQGRFDYVFSDPEDPKKQHRVSGKDYRGSQAGSAQADQATATLERGVEVAAQQRLKSILANKPKKKSGETDQQYKERLAKYKLDSREKKKEIVSSSKETLNKIKELMASTKGMSPEGQKDVYTQVQSHIDSLEKTVPGVKRAAGQEMLQGKGQFSKSKTAQSMWTTGGGGASFRDPRQQSVGLRARAGKGKGREMAVAGDIQAAPKEKESQKARQSTFASFSRQAQAAVQQQYNQTAADLDQQVATAAAEVDAANKAADKAAVVRFSNGKSVPKKNKYYLTNNPDEAEKYSQTVAAANAAKETAQSNFDAVNTALQTHISSPPPTPTVDALGRQQGTPEQPVPTAPEQPVAPAPEAPQNAPTPPTQRQRNPASKEPQQQQVAPEQPTQTASTPQEDPKEKKRRETRERMAAAGQKLGVA